MDRAIKKVEDNEEMKALLDSTRLEENFGETIRTNIDKRLKLLQLKAKKVLPKE